LLLFNVFSVFSQSVDVTACAGDHAVYAATGFTGSTYEYTLDNNDAGELIVLDTDTILVKWGTTTGLYRLGVLEINSAGCPGDWAYINVEVVNAELAQFTRNEYYLCEDEESAVTVDFNKNAFKSWQWIDERIRADGVIRHPGTFELLTIDHNNCVARSFTTVRPCSEKPKEFLVTVSVNNNMLGSATGGGIYIEGTSATVVATLLNNNGYNFVNWTVNGESVSTESTYTFTVTEDVDLVANFNVILDFDTYVATKWNNTFMLYRTTLESEGYDITGCKWYEDGVLIFDGTTYSAGPGINDLLKMGVTYYFVVSTSRHGDLRSTDKVLTEYIDIAAILAYPNPLRSGDLLTVENITEGSPIMIYNMMGALVQRFIATGETTTFQINNLPSGVYIVRTINGEVKIVIDN